MIQGKPIPTREGSPLRTPEDASQTPAGPVGSLGGGPVLPTESALAAQHPLPAPGTRLTGGLLHGWQHRNVDASMPIALRQLVAAGNLDNLRLALRAEGAADTDEPHASRASGVTPPAGLGYHGPVFMDSDIYKTLEAIGWQLQSAPSQDLDDFASGAIELLAKVQRPDGYLNSYIQASGDSRYGSLASSHEMYCDGHFFQAAVALSRSDTPTGQQAMDIATKLADHLVKEFAGQSKGLDGHPIVETALVELYRATGTAAYRDLAAQFVEQRGHGLVGEAGYGIRYLQDHQPVREMTTMTGHAVRAVYLDAGVTDVATETGDEELLATSERRWADMVATKTALTGGNGSRHNDEAFGDHFELPPDRAYNETCAAIASFQWSWRLLLATGDAKYADHMERILYNGFASAINTAGDRFFYVNPLQRREDHFEKDDPGRRREWFKTACCPPNTMRLLASLHHYVATATPGTLTIHQYATATITGAGLTVETATDYPWDGTITVRVTSAPGTEPAAQTGAPDASATSAEGTERELALRIPAWSTTAGPLLVEVNSSPERFVVPPDRYLRLRRSWQPGDVLRLHLDMTPRWTFPDSRVDAVRGCAALERGPLVYCFEQTDHTARLDELTISPGATPTEQAVTLPGIGHTIQLTAPGWHHPPSSPATASWRSLRDRSKPRAFSTAPSTARPPTIFPSQPVTLTAIPYFQWDNRGPGAMRVWIPTGPASSA
ncbi:MAG TPA: beta-L-arabinofuranosidase domain-containing protein [Trebonia sp.]|nr:beta-L-arabinofuranosidase domain-containing protein [Trebonia sp.]